MTTDVTARVRTTHGSIAAKAFQVFANQHTADSQGGGFTPAPPSDANTLEPAPDRQRETPPNDVEGIRRAVAAQKQLPDALVGFLTGETHDEVVAQADALIAHVQRPNLDAQIAAAESAGDTRLALRLKTQKFGL